MELPRGMKDFVDSETANIEHIRSHFKQLSNLYGFSFMDPSPIELLSTLETKSGPAIKDEIYYFKDKGDREIALRFDFTMGLTRYATSQKSMKLPAKISSFGGVFRYDEPQKGRYRYFHQWDLEIYGKPNLESESEIIELTSRLFDSLLLKNITIDVNHRNLVESYINKIFDSKESQLVGDMLRAVDKIAKKSKDLNLSGFGANCGIGAPDLLATINDISKNVDLDTVVISKANCGIPEFVDGNIMYSGTEELMSEYVQIAMNSGARIIGGCCGTSFDHVRAMRKAMDRHVVSKAPTLQEIEQKVGTMSEGSKSIFQGDDSKPTRQRRSRRLRV